MTKHPLAALAVVSMLVFGTPAGAGMVATPKAGAEETRREALAALPEAALHAGTDAVVAVVVIVCVVAFVALVVTVVIISKIEHFHRHFHSPAPPRLPCPIHIR